MKENLPEKRHLVRLEILNTLSQYGSLKEMCKKAISLIKTYLHSDVVALRLREGEDYPYFVNEGFPKEFIELENYLCLRDEKGDYLRDAHGRALLACMCGNIINARYSPDKVFFTKNGSFWTNSTSELLASTTEKDRGTSTRNVCNEYGYESVALIPVKSTKYNLGLLQINDKRRNLFTVENIEFLEELGHILGIVVERKRAEESLKYSEERYALAQRVANIGSWDWDIRTGKLKWSEEIEPMFGFAPGKFEGSYETFLECVHPQDRQHVVDSVNACIEEGKDYDIEHRIVLSDGTVRWVLETGNVVRNENNKAIRMLGIVKDVTERKEAEEILKRDKEIFERLVNERTQELLKVQAELDKAKRLSDIGTLAATVAHELRNPLGVIRTAAYNIQRKRLNTLIDKHLAHIEKKVSESDQIINNLLNYSRVRMPSYEKIKIYDILDECLAFMRKQFNKQKIKINKDFRSIKNKFIEADPLQIKEIFNNILTNAYQAITDKKGRIEVSSRLSGKNLIEISVKDSGEGIDKEDLKRVLEPFFTRRSKGTGLGLTICDELVGLHNGKISIESEKDKGTKVIVILPVKKVE